MAAEDPVRKLKDVMETRSFSQGSVLFLIAMARNEVRLPPGRNRWLTTFYSVLFVPRHGRSIFVFLFQESKGMIGMCVRNVNGADETTVDCPPYIPVIPATNLSCARHVEILLPRHDIISCGLEFETCRTVNQIRSAIVKGRKATG
jgi:hypothetical protein